MRFWIKLATALALSVTVSADSGRITPHVTFVRGPVNGALITHAGKTLAIYGDPRPNPASAETVLFTHHRRDVVWAGRALLDHGAQAIAPAAESSLFTDTQQFWEKYRLGRFRDLSMQSSRILATPLARVRSVRGGERIDWHGLPIEVIDTPGPTRGAVSYLIEIDGSRIAFTGDLIYGDGKLLDLYSLQDAIPEAKEDAYHGYGARAADLIASLDRIAAHKPDFLIPARGPVIRNPQQAIATLKERIRNVFTSHFEIDALRWYRGDANLRTQARRLLADREVDWMPMAETAKLPEWVLAIENSRLLVSSSGAAFLIDCGSKRILEKIRGLQKEGRIQAVEGIYATHYHSDHTNAIAEAAEVLRCPIFGCREMKDILERPQAYAMPVQTAIPIRPVTATAEGQSQRWHEFEFTYTHFPGQTWYHGGLLVKKDGGETVFFVGDSFTPTGIDDYCPLNRNFVAPEKGYSYCLDVLKRTSAWLVNQHVEPMFRYSPPQLERMRTNFTQRAKLFKALFPWEHPNFGLDEQWARFYPYSMDAKPGQGTDLQFVLLNHSSARREFRVTPHVPPGWSAGGVVKVSLAPREERTVTLRLTPAPNASGLHVITADVAFGNWDLREWTEAMILVRP